MSKQNKANKNNYSQAGRLTPDEMARERMNQGEQKGHSKDKENVIGRKRAGAQESSRPRSAPEEPE